MKAIEIVLKIYEAFSSKVKEGRLPISLKPPALVGTVQDDPFDTWVGDEIKKALPSLEVFKAGKLTTPDIVLRYKLIDVNYSFSSTTIKIPVFYHGC